MNTELLKKLGNTDQICGIRESVLLRGNGEGTKIARCYNAAGLDFTVVEDRCMDLYDFSYKGINLAFHSKNGLVSPLKFSPAKDEFPEQWTGGMLFTCGLDNVNDHCREKGEDFPAHGRIGAVPAQNFGTELLYEGEKTILHLEGEMHEICMYRRHFKLNRDIRVEAFSKKVELTDTITNMESSPEDCLLLYHVNFGYPLVQDGTEVKVFGCEMKSLRKTGGDPVHMSGPLPSEGFQAEAFLGSSGQKTAGGFVYNRDLGLGCLLEYDTANLPALVEWKHLKAGDYVVALEPTNTFAMNREGLRKEGKTTRIGGFETVRNHVSLEVIEGNSEIDRILYERF